MYVATYVCTYIPVATVTVPSVLIVFEAEWTIHWKVVVWLIENTVSERALGLLGLFSWYSGLLSISCWVNDVPLIIHVTGNTIACWYPQLMITLLPLHAVVFSGGLVIITTTVYIAHTLECTLLFIATYTYSIQQPFHITIITHPLCT